MPTHSTGDSRPIIEKAITEHGLPNDFMQTVNRFYRPLAQQLFSDFKAERATDPATSPAFFVGIQGSQGSGKSTCAAFLKLLLEAEFGLTVLASSIDDFYLTLHERQAMAANVHPLFQTRGVPGTHDVGMLNAMFDAASRAAPFSVPLFDKSIDDRAPRERWQTVQGPVDVVILEGWCVGVTAQNPKHLDKAINNLEEKEDPQGVWRDYINRALSQDYQALFSRLDRLVALQAPSFECVYGWRSLQEEKMILRLAAQGLDTSLAQTPEQLARFIAHYQRLTEHALQTMPEHADTVLMLDENHRFTEAR